MVVTRNVEITSTEAKTVFILIFFTSFHLNRSTELKCSIKNQLNPYALLRMGERQKSVTPDQERN
jgi:hypothetical protein